MALLSYLFAFAHFGSELLIFRTAKLNIAVLGPVIVSGEVSRFRLFVLPI